MICKERDFLSAEQIIFLIIMNCQLKGSDLAFIWKARLWILIYMSPVHFSARTQNCEKRLLASSWPSVLPSVCPHGTSQLPLDGFSWNLIFEQFFKSVEKIQISLKSDKNNGYFTWRPIYIFDYISLNYS